jgi:tRNA wybutosine-synthesizing protein 2
LGSVLALRLPESLRPHFASIGRLWQEELGVDTVLQHSGPVEGDWRIPRFERIAGDGTEVEVRENGIRYRFDAAKILFSRGNKGERARAGRLVRPQERVLDMFAGIGYFSLPAALTGKASRVDACETNPLSVRYLAENAQLNGVSGKIVIHPVDNREAALDRGAFDRAFLGYLPTSLEFVRVALPLLRPEGGWIHVHQVVDAHDAERTAQMAAEREVRLHGGAVVESSSRRVKAFGPGRTHVVADVRAIPG